MSKKTRHPSRTGFLAFIATAVFFGLVGLLFVNRATSPPETGPMGGIMYEANMQVSGVATAAGLQVEGAEVAMGQIPNNVTVVPEWTITNTSDYPITLGEPHASVIEGCCPGQLELTATTLAPGESTQLTFPLQMHDGMDGPHDFDIHVPVLDTDVYLTLGVNGTFGST